MQRIKGALIRGGETKINLNYAEDQGALIRGGETKINLNYAEDQGALIRGGETKINLNYAEVLHNCYSYIPKQTSILVCLVLQNNVKTPNQNIENMNLKSMSAENLVHCKNVMQGKLIAVAYTLRTY